MGGANLRNAYRYWLSCSLAQVHLPCAGAPTILVAILNFEFQIDLALITSTIKENELPALRNLVIALTFDASTWNLIRRPI